MNDSNKEILSKKNINMSKKNIYMLKKNKFEKKIFELCQTSEWKWLKYQILNKSL